MKLKSYKNCFREPLRQATLCFLIKDDLVLLAMKKRGFGVGKFNGIGGKKEPTETLEETAIREIYEEVNVQVKKLKNVATLNCYFPDNPNLGQQVTVYLIETWEGDPQETEEMSPKWFNKNSLPFDQMWPDEKLWLPLVLDGKEIEAEFMFGENENIIDYDLKILQ